jgi:hypothetical protein
MISDANNYNTSNMQNRQILNIFVKYDILYIILYYLCINSTRFAYHKNCTRVIFLYTYAK